MNCNCERRNNSGNFSHKTVPVIRANGFSRSFEGSKRQVTRSPLHLSGPQPASSATCSAAKPIQTTTISSLEKLALVNTTALERGITRAGCFLVASTIRNDTRGEVEDRIACTNPTRRDKRFEYACTLGLSSCHGLSTVVISSCGRCHVPLPPVFSNQFPLTGMLMRHVYTEDRYARWRRFNRFPRFNNQF